MTTKFVITQLYSPTISRGYYTEIVSGIPFSISLEYASKFDTYENALEVLESLIIPKDDFKPQSETYFQIDKIFIKK